MKVAGQQFRKALRGERVLGPMGWSHQVFTGGNPVSLKVRTEKAQQKSWSPSPEMHICGDMPV